MESSLYVLQSQTRGGRKRWCELMYHVMQVVRIIIARASEASFFFSPFNFLPESMVVPGCLGSDAREDFKT
jgi:hypothetical protein